MILGEGNNAQKKFALFPKTGSQSAIRKELVSIYDQDAYLSHLDVIATKRVKPTRADMFARYVKICLVRLGLDRELPGSP